MACSVIVITLNTPPMAESTLAVPPSGPASRPAPRRTTLIATGGLIAVTAAWGSTFVVVKDAIKSIPVMDFLFLRFTIAALVLLAIRPRALRLLDRTALAHGVLLGLVLALGYATQTFGLETASASVSGFITGLFVVFTPLIAAVLLRRRVARSVWAAVATAMVGLGLMSLHGFSIGHGELLTVVSAFCYALHIVGLGEWSHKYDTYALTVVQVSTVAIVSLAITLVSGTRGSHGAGIVLPSSASGWWAVAVTALLCTAAAYFVQTWSQARIPPMRAAVVLTMEPVFAGVTGYLAGEMLGLRGWVGALLVLGAMYLVEFAPGGSSNSTP